MDFGLQDKAALVLCAGGGLGQAIALALAEEGMSLVIADIDANGLSATERLIRENGRPCTSIEWDLSNRDLAAGNVAKATAAYGDIDVLVNITGGPAPSRLDAVTPDLWAKSFEMMALSIMTITDLLLPPMRGRGWGRVITSTSSGVIAPIPTLGISNTLRAALVAWSKTLAREVARDGVTCNVIVPGRIATSRIAFLDQKAAEREGIPVTAVQARSHDTIPMGRYGSPKEYAAATAFLASDAAGYITGSVLRVDGGLIPSL